MIICDSCRNQDSFSDPICDFTLSFHPEEDVDDDEVEAGEDESRDDVNQFTYHLQLCPKCKKAVVDGVRYAVDSILHVLKSHPEVKNAREDLS